MYVDSRQGHLATKVPRSTMQTVVCLTGDHRDHSDCVKPPVSQVQRPGASRTYLGSLSGYLGLMGHNSRFLRSAGCTEPIFPE